MAAQMMQRYGATPWPLLNFNIMKPTQKEIEEQIDLAIENDGKYSGQTYEEGVRMALEWALYGGEDKPMD